jgi:hypothetical protein
MWRKNQAKEQRPNAHEQREERAAVVRLEDAEDDEEQADRRQHRSDPVERTVRVSGQRVLDPT